MYPVVMNAVNAQNLEEAANLAAEFIYSALTALQSCNLWLTIHAGLDNLPNEVNHLLQEIKVKEARVQGELMMSGLDEIPTLSEELQQEIDRDSTRYIRHSMKSSSSPSPTDFCQRAPTPKTVGIPAKIQELYAELHEISNEKCILAQCLIDLIERTCSRLDVDLVKVKYLQGDAPDSTSSLGKVTSGIALGLDFGPSGRNPAQQISESLRNALSNSSESRQGSATPVASTVGATSGGSTTKSDKIALPNGPITDSHPRTSY